MKIELKNVHYAAFASEETSCYSASLYVDGTKIGTVSNDGHGGCDSFHGDQAAYRAADAWCRGNLPKIVFGDRPPLDADIETHCGALLVQWLLARDLKRDMKTKILMRDPDDGKVYAVKHRGRPEATIAGIDKRYPGAAILNRLPFDAALAIYREALA